MKNVLGKIAMARLFIKAHPVKKDGRNTFSNYDYFTPEIVGKMVSDACIEANIVCVFNLKKDDLGYYGELITTDLESGESLTSIMRTEKPVIKATNETQQMGGMNTYTKRYCLMSLFDIEDNTMDFDSDNSKKNEKKPTETKSNEPDKPWLNENDAAFAGAVEKIKAGKSSIAALRSYFKISKAIEEKLNAATKKQVAEPINN